MSAKQDDAARRRRISLAEQAFKGHLNAVPTEVRPGDPERAAEAAHRMRVILGLMPADEQEGTDG